MRTGAAQRSFFDQRDVHAFGTALNRGGNRVPAAEYNEIVMFGIHKLISRPVPKYPNAMSMPYFHLLRGDSMGEWFLSRRDSMIVARHEVPGIISLYLIRNVERCFPET